MTKQHNIDKTSLEMIHQIKITVKTNMDHMNEQHGYSQSSMGNTSLWIGPSNEEISHEIFSWKRLYFLFEKNVLLDNKLF